jgi:hypothetical protein
MRKSISILVVALVFLATNCTQKSAEDSNEKVVKLVETLYVHPDVLGIHSQEEAQQICDKMNAQNSYGHNDWRLPFPYDLFMIYENKDKIDGLVDGYYLGGGGAINEFGETTGYPVLDMSLGNTKWRTDTGEWKDYMPVDGKANLRLVR